MSTETDQAAARKAQDLYRFDGSDPGAILALRSAFRAGAEFAAERTPAPAPSVVPEAAVEATAEAMWNRAARKGRFPYENAGLRAEFIHDARAALTAALPHLTAAPSATREVTEDEVTEAVTEALTDAHREERGMSRHRGLTFEDESVIRDRAACVIDLVTARFNITPKEDR